MSERCMNEIKPCAHFLYPSPGFILPNEATYSPYATLTIYESIFEVERGKVSRISSVALTVVESYSSCHRRVACLDVRMVEDCRSHGSR